MKIDTLFKSESGKLYVGTDDGNGKFTGKSFYDGVVHGRTIVGMNGSVVARFVKPFELTVGSKALPLHADIKVDGAATQYGLGQYLTSLTRAQQRNADGHGNDGGDA